MKSKHSILHGFRALLVALLIAVSPMLVAVERMPALVDVGWLAAQIDADDVVVLDVRLAEDFEFGHVRGAVNVPYTALFADGYLMPGIEELRELFGAAGVDMTRRVVVYDEGSFIWAARAYWLLETLGLRTVAMLDVGFGNWDDGQLAIADEAVAPVRRNFVPAVDHRRLETKLSTLLALESTDRVIMDGRSKDEYLGIESSAQRFGHIPGAVHFSWSANFIDDGRGGQMLPLDTLRPLYAGLDPEKHIIVYCNGGAQSAVNYIVLQALGYSVSIYDGSWIEWGNDVAVPIDNPSHAAEGA